ncbi:MAG: 5'-methylthioadenosine/S-adenosylhomocysteine nucleosidase [Ruthenibacterium lactatiformans]
MSQTLCLLPPPQACTEAAGVKYIVGKIATGDTFVGDSATKNAIAANCAPDCVEMEGAAVAHVAAKNGVPCVVLRAMSDNADEEAYETLVVKEFDVSEYCRTAAKISAALIAAL